MAGVKGLLFEAAIATIILFVECLLPGLDEFATGNSRELAEFILICLALVLSMSSVFMLLHRFIRLCLVKMTWIDFFSVVISLTTIAASVTEYYNSVKNKKKSSAMRIASITLAAVAFFCTIIEFSWKTYLVDNAVVAVEAQTEDVEAQTDTTLWAILTGRTTKLRNFVRDRATQLWAFVSGQATGLWTFVSGQATGLWTFLCGQATDGEGTDGEPTDGEGTDGEPTDGEPTDGDA